MPARRRRRRGLIGRQPIAAPAIAARGSAPPPTTGTPPPLAEEDKPPRVHPGAPRVIGWARRPEQPRRALEFFPDKRGHSTTRHWHRWSLPALLACVTLLRLFFAAHVPLAPDETYYWVWSRALAAGYPDHPPMVALWIAIGTGLMNDSAFGIRLLGPLALAGGTWFLSMAAADLAPTPGRAGRAAVIAPMVMNATLAANAGAVLMTPDTPLIFFWSAALWALARLLATGNPRWWLVAGAAIGCAGLSKYSALLGALGVVLWSLGTPAMRPQLRTPWPWAGAGLAALIFAPVLIWNAGHDWVSFARQGGRLLALEGGGAPRYLAELIGGQIGLATPGVALLMGLAVWRLWPAVRREPANGLLLATAAVPMAVFTLHALGARVQANWPVLCYPSLALAVGVAGLRYWREAAAGGAAISFIVLLMAAFPPVSVPLAPFARIGGWDRFGQAVHVAAAGANAQFVAAPDYALASELAFHMGGPVAAADARWRHFDLPRAGIELQTGILIASSREPPPNPAIWGRVTYLKPLNRHAYGRNVETYSVWQVAPQFPVADAVRLAPRRLWRSSLLDAANE